MDIVVGDYVLRSDPNQFVVYHITKSGAKAKTPGEQVENFVGNYSSLESAFKCLPSRMLMRSNASSLAEVVDLLERYRLLIETAMKGA
jgi:hypothetical protein